MDFSISCPMDTNEVVAEEQRAFFKKKKNSFIGEKAAAIQGKLSVSLEDVMLENTVSVFIFKNIFLA